MLGQEERMRLGKRWRVLWQPVGGRLRRPWVGSLGHFLPFAWMLGSPWIVWWEVRGASSPLSSDVGGGSKRKYQTLAETRERKVMCPHRWNTIFNVKNTQRYFFKESTNVFLSLSCTVSFLSSLFLWDKHGISTATSMQITVTSSLRLRPLAGQLSQSSTCLLGIAN